MSETPQLHDYIPLSEAANLVPGRPSAITLWRWHKRGVGRKRTKLQAARIGRNLYTTAAWVAEFLDALSKADEPKGFVPRKQVVFPSDAERELKAMGA